MKWFNFSVHCLGYMRAGFLLIVGAKENDLIWKKYQETSCLQTQGIKSTSKFVKFIILKSCFVSERVKSFNRNSATTIQK